MPAHSFTIHVDPDELARVDLAAALAPARGDGDDSHQRAAAVHHGAGDPRQAARERSGRSRAGRGAQGGGRTYAFRRS